MTAAALVAFVAVYSLGVGGFMPIMVASWVNGLSITEEAAGYVATANFAGGTLGLFIAIFLLTRRPVAHIAALALAVAITGDGISMLANDAVSLAVVRFWAGCGHGLLSTAVINWLARHEQPGRCFGIFMLLQVLIFAPIMAAVPALQEEIGRVAPYLVLLTLAAFSVFLLPVLNLNGGDKPLPRKVVGAKDEEDGKAYRWFHPVVLQSVIAPTLFLIATFGVWAYLERYGVSLGIAEYLLGPAFVGILLTGIPASLAAVWLGDRIGRTIPIVAGFVLTTLPLGLFLVQSSSLLLFMVACGLFNMGWCFSVPYFQAIQADIDRSGQIVTVANLAGAIGCAVGPGLFALMLGGGGYVEAFLLMIVVYGVGLFTVVAPACAADRRKHIPGTGEMVPGTPGL
ncbi:MAG: hypothetical protein CVT83_04175 [Alphaproteobacteria bacterium HGW-Alphaproteobacteria-5]|nr:MAG: hypothetical protein CVT83_04175 [Alphaproteobacteria bacterium HGW-Alphaproteobacteria-5]